MGFFGKLAQSVIDIAILPVEVVKDVATLGEESFTAQRLRKAQQHAEEAYDELNDL
jgi:hypothetical protein